jgi:hypothetical protein
VFEFDVPMFEPVSTGVAERTPLHSEQVATTSVREPLRVTVIGLLPVLVMSSAYM